MVPYHVISRCRSRPAEAGNVVMICAVCGGVECGVTAYSSGVSHVMRGSMSCHVVVMVCVWWRVVFGMFVRRRGRGREGRSRVRGPEKERGEEW